MSGAREVACLGKFTKPRMSILVSCVGSASSGQRAPIRSYSLFEHHLTQPFMRSKSARTTCVPQRFQGEPQVTRKTTPTIPTAQIRQTLAQPEVKRAMRAASRRGEPAIRGAVPFLVRRFPKELSGASADVFKRYTGRVAKEEMVADGLVHARNNLPVNEPPYVFGALYVFPPKKPVLPADISRIGPAAARHEAALREIAEQTHLPSCVFGGNLYACHCIVGRAPEELAAAALIP